MITNNKKHKEVQFHKLKTQYFNNIKKYNINKSTNEIAFIKQNMSPIKRSKRKSIRSSIINNFLHVEEQSVSGFKYINHIKIPNNICSTNHVNNTNFKDIIHLQKKHKERHQILKQDSKKSKKNISTRNISMNNNIDKKIINFAKIENDKNNSYNIVNNNNITNRTKRSKKIKNNKENKEEKKNNDDTHEKEKEKEKPENLVKTIKKKFFCCL
jgi:hypothetical protein